MTDAFGFVKFASFVRISTNTYNKYLMVLDFRPRSFLNFLAFLRQAFSHVLLLLRLLFEAIIIW